MARQFGIRELDPSLTGSGADAFAGMDLSESPNPIQGSSSFPALTPPPTLSDLARILDSMQQSMAAQQKIILDQQQAILAISQAQLASTTSAAAVQPSATSTVATGSTPVPRFATTPPIADSSAPSLAPSFGKLKGNKPDEYSGRRDQTNDFLAQCTLYFRINPMAETEKVAFAASYLRGAAFKWFGTYELSNGMIATFADFKSALLRAFGETDAAEKAKAALRKLKQTKACSQYNSDFNRLVAEAGYSTSDDNILIDVYQEGLKMEVRTLMLSLPIRKTLQETMNDAMQCDDRIYQLNQSKRGQGNLLLPRAAAPTNGPVPMEIDAVTVNTHIQQGKLTEEERDRRKRENLCAYDGKADCPGRDDVNLCPKVQQKKTKSRRQAPAQRR
jgi:hypothetical protein